MDHALLVGRLRRIRDLPRHRQRIGDGDRAARDHVGEGLALDQFEDDREGGNARNCTSTRKESHRFSHQCYLRVSDSER
jgi:hypothetical protein